MKKILVMSSLLAVSVFASSYYTAMGYAGHIIYKNQTKKFGNFEGIYFSQIKTKSYNLNLNFSNLTIKYKYGIPKYFERDAGFFIEKPVYQDGNLFKAGWGLNGIWNKQYVGYKLSRIWTVSADNYNYANKIYTSVKDYYSSYNTGLKVNQISFTLGKYFVFPFASLTDEDAKPFYASVTVNYIKPLKKGYTNKNKYFNYDITLSQTIRHTTAYFTYSTGRNAYKVQNNGFLVNNLGDEYKYGAVAGIDYKFHKNYILGVNVTYHKLEENNAETLISSLNFSYLF